MIPRLKVNYGVGDLVRSLRPGHRGNRPKERLCQQLRDYFGVDNVLLTPSGRAGLYFILRASQRPRVVVPAFTCKAVVEAARLAGKQVEYVEVDRDDFNMSAAGLEALAGDDAIVLATHQFGIPCPIEKIVDVCRARGALVVEDVAPAFGTRSNGRLTGTFGDAAFFSFDSRKAINVPVKAGFVIVRDAERYERVRSAYSAEIQPLPGRLGAKFWLTGLAYQLLGRPLLYRLFHLLYFQMRGVFVTEEPELDLRRSPFYRYDISGWQAFLAAEQMARIDEIVERRRANYRKLHTALAGCEAIELPPVDERQEWVPTRFAIRARGDKLDYYRRASRRGIDFAFSFTYLASPPAYTGAHRLASSVLNAPYYLKLSDDEIERVGEVLRSIDAEN